MKKKGKLFATCIAMTFVATACHPEGKGTNLSAETALDYCGTQTRKTLLQIKGIPCALPRSIGKQGDQWHTVNAYDWTSGFWPGILWYCYKNTGDERLRQEAERYTECLTDLLNPEHRGDHDLGFQFLCSFVNGYKLTGNGHYKQTALAGADKLASFYNPKVGTICSWAHMLKEKGWPHNTIMDNMMNLELLFWAAKNGGDKAYYDMAESHARVTMENQFRSDYTNYHVAIYDTINGQLIKGVTNQGFSDESFWARGQAWAIYGYTMVYRETGNKEFLRFAEKVTDTYLERLPEDGIPYWDFDAPGIPDEPRDASSAAIVASGLIELSQIEDDAEKAEIYFQAAEHMLASLSSEHYQSREHNPAFLMHSTGNLPAGYEIDASINYADYYYIEALTRYKEAKETR